MLLISPFFDSECYYAILVETSFYTLQEFILSNSERKKQSSSLQDGSSKKALDNFRQMVEYCEEYGCRRKKILESFGEMVSASLCEKSCDACKQPNIVAKNLEELKTAAAFRQRNGSSRIFITSLSNFKDGDYSEFWNHGDEASGSEEDISDSDEALDAAKNVASTGRSTKLRIQDKIEMLQRAEEKYYQNKNPEKQVNKLDKNAIPETLRENGRQRLLNTLNQNKRISDLRMSFEDSASILENECYKKYSKSGKSFYLSQMASTVRWLSTADRTELTNKLGCAPDPPKDLQQPSEANCSSESLTSSIALSAGLNNEKTNSAVLETEAAENVSPATTLPPIPSFSEYINSRKVKSHHESKSKKRSPDMSQKNIQKKMRS
nr:ATP-dependent DNA helicase Q-like 3 isoform X1 [Ipomoea batatas]